VGEATYEFARAQIEFHDDFVKAYGEAAWKKFQSEEGRTPMSPTRRSKSLGRRCSEDRQGASEDRRSKATLLVEGAREPMDQVKEGEEWKVRTLCAEDPPNGPNSTAKIFRAMAETIRKYRKAIGKPGDQPGKNINERTGTGHDEDDDGTRDDPPSQVSTSTRYEWPIPPATGGKGPR